MYFCTIAVLVRIIIVHSFKLSPPKKISGPWYYLADGLDSSHPFDTMPSWFKDAGNFVSLAFMNPADLPKSQDPVPEAFKKATTDFQAMGKVVFFSIGGAAYSGNWGSGALSVDSGKKAAALAQKYGVGIEIDYEGGGDNAGILEFIKGFRSECPMGKCLLSMDLYGSPGGAPWQKDLVPKALPPVGVPGQIYGDGNWLDWANVMVIDGQSLQIATKYWQQWFDAKLLNANRTTFGTMGGFASASLGICSGSSSAKTQIDFAVNYLASYGTYGLTSWAVCPPVPYHTTSCADWSPSCNSNAPGFNYMCQKLNAC